MSQGGQQRRDCLAASPATRGAADIRLWIADCRQWDENLLAGHLSPQERQRAEAFRQARDRSRFIIRHGLLRRLLGHYTQIPESELVIQATLSGRPMLAAGSNPAGLDFSLARSQDLCLYAVADGIRVGVDIEYVDQRLDIPGIVSQFFAPAEARSIASRPPAQRPALFYRMWTAKEACVKATGEGLATPLGEVVVSVDAEGRPDRARLRDNEWKLLSFFPLPDFAAALAMPPGCTATVSLTTLDPAFPRSPGSLDQGLGRRGADLS